MWGHYAKYTPHIGYKRLWPRLRISKLGVRIPPGVHTGSGQQDRPPHIRGYDTFFLITVCGYNQEWVQILPQLTTEVAWVFECH
jgi:hypothetical protein